MRKRWVTTYKVKITTLSQKAYIIDIIVYNTQFTDNSIFIDSIINDRSIKVTDTYFITPQFVASYEILNIIEVIEEY